MAGQVLPQFQEHPDAWQRVPAILQQSSSTQTKVSNYKRGTQHVDLIIDCGNLSFAAVHRFADPGQADCNKVEGTTYRPTAR